MIDAVAFLALKKSGQRKCMWGQRLEVCVRISFTVVNLHELWSNYPRSICHVIDLVYEKRGQPGGKPKFWGPWPPYLPRRNVTAYTPSHRHPEHRQAVRPELSRASRHDAEMRRDKASLQQQQQQQQQLLRCSLK